MKLASFEPSLKDMSLTHRELTTLETKTMGCGAASPNRSQRPSNTFNKPIIESLNGKPTNQPSRPANNETDCLRPRSIPP